jgi:hypothetical protein
MKLRMLLCLALTMGWTVPASTQEPLAERQGPANVLRFEKGCRHSQAGWIVLHIAERCRKCHQMIWAASSGSSSVSSRESLQLRSAFTR